MDQVFLRQEVAEACRENSTLLDRYHNEAEFAAQVDAIAATIIAHKYRGIDYMVDAALVAVILAKHHKARHWTPEDENG